MSNAYFQPIVAGWYAMISAYHLADQDKKPISVWTMAG